MKSIAELALILLFFSSLHCKTATGQSIRTVEVHQKLQMPMKDGRLIDWVDSVKVISYQNFILFQVPVNDRISRIDWDSTGEPHETLLSSETKHRYFIYAKTDSVGFEYDSLNAKKIQTKSVDSFLNTKVFGNLVFYDKVNDSLVESKELNNDIFLEKYIPKVKFDYSYSDSLYFFFSKRLKNLNYTLSNELDSIKQTKLFKVVAIYNAGYDTGLKAQLPRREYIFEIRPAILSNTKEIIGFFERFEKWYGENKSKPK